ncbi:MAG: glutaredoxin family protein [Planctomycetes bacterium]|nr:glutaredoxin family protein [Planctomycetota bacterium]
MLRALSSWLRRPVPARLFTREGCGLCDELVEVLRAEGLLGRLDLVRVDVDADRSLKKLYGLRLPVLEVQGEVVFEGRPERAAVAEALRGALAQGRER